MDQDEFIQESVNRHLAHMVAVRGLLAWVIALLVAILIAVSVSGWVIYRALEEPGASPF